MLVSPPDGGLIRPKLTTSKGHRLCTLLMLNPAILTRWPIKDIDCGGVLASGFSDPDTPSDIGCVQEGSAWVET